MAFSNINMADLMHASSDNDKEDLSKKMREPLSGKTAEEVISYAQKVTAERELKQKEQAIQEIKTLEKKKADSDMAKEELKKIQVLSARFTREPEEDGEPQPVIRLVVKNKSENVISRAYMHGVIASSGHSDPWLESKFFYDIPDGLKPNEEATWALAPPKNSEWGQLYAPSDAVFTVTVMRVDGTYKRALFDATMFTEEDGNKLDELKKKYP